MPLDSQDPWRNRKKAIFTNIFAAVDFDGRFVYILPGWEGSVNDGRVFNDALSKGFVIPNGRFYLADAGYSNSCRLLVLYRGVWYHLQESARLGRRPDNPEELFNLRHSQLRNIVERVFGRLKGTFRIHRTKPYFGIATQVKVIYATAA